VPGSSPSNPSMCWVTTHCAPDRSQGIQDTATQAKSESERWGPVRASRALCENRFELPTLPLGLSQWQPLQRSSSDGRA